MLLLYTLLIGLTISPLWLKSPRFIKSQFYLLFVAVTFTMVIMTPKRAQNSAPLNKFPPSLIAFFSCTQMISEVEFCPLENGSRRQFGDNSCICKNENALSTLAYCYQTGFPGELMSLVEMCNRDYNTSLSKDSIKVSLEKYHNSAREIEDHSARVQTKTVDFPVKLSSAAILRYRASYDQFLGNYNRSIDYGWYVVVFWIVIFASASVCNWAKVLVPHTVKHSTGPVSRWIRSRITLPALMGKEKTNEKKLWNLFDYLPPTRLETLVVGAFSLLVLHLTFYKIHFVPNDPIFGSRIAAYMRCFAVRTGIIASSLLPLSVLFAGRNNILQWITRWEYSSFVMYHRWLSRVMVLLLAVHSFGYCRHILTPLKEIKTYLLFGLLGTVSGFTILVQGLLVLRRKWYEAFLAIHIILAVCFVAGAWLHVDDLNFLWYFYVSACLWILDRVIRVQRLCSFGFPRAKIQLFEDDTLKFSVPVPAGFFPEGGGHCFIHFLHWSCFWQSHPFTYTVVDNNVVFYVKVKKGITKSIKNYLMEHPTKAMYMKIAVEGSYGEATPASKYDSSVFIAGGNGIPGIYAEAVEVSKRGHGFKRVKLIWIIREYTSLMWFYDELMDLARSDIEIEIYVTQPHMRSPAVISDKSALLENTFTHRAYSSINNQRDLVQRLKDDLSHLAFREGRPDIEKMIRVNTEESPGSSCFVTCGHPVMVDEIRYQVAQNVAISSKRIDYFEQLQVWA